VCNFMAPVKTSDIYQPFNVSVSGPIIKDKTFFYGLWNGERVPGKSFLTANVPTPQERAGDFSQLLSLARPVTIIDPATGAPFPNNAIPASRINAVSLKAQNNYLPLPNLGAAGSLVNNFQLVHPYPGGQFITTVATIRLDHPFTHKNSIYSRFTPFLP